MRKSGSKTSRKFQAYGFAATLRILLLLFFLPLNSFSQNGWKFQHRLQAGLEQDSNVFEASDRNSRASSLDARLHFKTTASRSWRKVLVRTSLSTGLQGYPEFTGESKFIGEIQSAVVWKMSRRVQATVSVGGFRKSYADGVLDFSHGSTGLRFDYAVSSNWRLSVLAEAADLNYDATTSFDHTAREWGIGFTRRLRKNARFEGQFIGGEVEYGRNALVLQSNDTLAFKDARHLDKFAGALLRISFGKKVLVNTSLEYTRNWSNSYGYSFDRVRSSTIIGMRLRTKWLLRLAAVLQQKTYDETLLAFSALEQDVERNQNNYLISDVSYDISHKLSYLVRVSVFKNEAFLRGTTYSKNQIFIGMEYRF